MVQLYGTKKKKRYNSEPINNVKLKIAMSVFGIIAIGMGIWFNDIVIKFDGNPIQDYVFATIVLLIATIQIVTLGIKRYTDVSKLKEFTNEQYLTFWTTIITVVIAIANVSGFIESFGIFANGILIFQGLLILLEVYR